MSEHTGNIARFKFIEAMILHHGFIWRIHIERCFSVKTATASRIISLYEDTTNNEVIYDRKEKQLKASKNFTPKFLNIEPEAFLEAAQIMAETKIIQYKMA